MGIDMISHVELVARATASQGSARGGGSNSLSGMLSTLIPLLFVSGAYLGAFLFFRTRQKRIYQPRTFVGTLDEFQKTPKTSQTTFGWIKEFWSLPDDYVLSHQSMDGYLYLRFFKLIITICFVGCIVTWPILFPVNATGPGGQTQFNILSFSNVPNSGNRYYAHTFVSWIFFTFVFYMITRESMFYVKLRQAYFLSPYVSSRISSRTVLFTNIPSEYLEPETLQGLYPSAKQVWVASDTQELRDLIDDRNKTAMKLEGAECKLSKDANNRRRKAKESASGGDEPTRWLDEKKRPTHRLKPLIGHKVDTIEWSRSHLEDLIPKVESLQERHWNGKTAHIPAAFIEFDTIEAAEEAFQRRTTRAPKAITPRIIGSRPNEIIWKNLGMTKTSRTLRYTGSTIIIAFMIIFWAIPVAFVGAVSNINSLESISFLSWIGQIPPVILGVVTGLLPTILLALLMSLVPVFCRFLAKFSGATSTGEIELTTQKWYFAFQVIQVFLVTTLSSGAAAVATQIVHNPGTAVGLLAESLPTASNFYINYFVLYGIAISAKAVANVIALALYIVLGRFMDTTPRKMMKRYTTLPNIKWGSDYPVYINLAVIAVTYSCIAPLVLGFATVGLSLVYIAFRYNMLYALDTTNISEQGRGYAMALQQLTTGIYLAELCMIGLFAINTAGSSIASAGPLVLMIIFFIATIVYHVMLNRKLKPYMTSLARYPLSTPTKGGYQSEAEEGDSERTSSKDPVHAEQGPVTNSEQYHHTGPKKWVQQLFHPRSLPRFAPELSQPHADYGEDVRREAYLDPAITSPTPLLWIIHDPLGVSTREKEATGKIIGTSDTGAWLDEKTGRLTTVWVGQEDKDENLAKEAPIYENETDY